MQPTITYLSNQTASEFDEQVTLTCEASGDPTPTISWSFENRVFTEGEQVAAFILSLTQRHSDILEQLDKCLKKKAQKKALSTFPVVTGSKRLFVNQCRPGRPSCKRTQHFAVCNTFSLQTARMSRVFFF